MLTTALSIPISLLLRNSGRYFRNLSETRLLQQAAASFVGQGPAQWFWNVYEPCPPSKFNWWVMQYHGLVKASARGPQRTALWLQGGAMGPFEKPCQQLQLQLGILN